MLYQTIHWLRQFAEDWGWWMVGASALAFVATLVLVPVFIVQLPDDYFIQHRRAASWRNYHPALRIAFVVLKNTAGVVILIGGFIMLVTPGQGLLSIVIGLMLIDFPGKWKLERRIVGQPRVLQAMNSLRARWGCEPLKTDRE